jgi:hypothetical protein
MKSPMAWFTLLVVVCIGGPYLFGVRPRTRAQWTWLAITIAFLAWILPLTGALRSR